MLQSPLAVANHPWHAGSPSYPHPLPSRPPLPKEMFHKWESRVAKVESAVGELEKLAQGPVDAGQVPGLAIAVVYKDEVIYLQGFGVRATAPDRTGPEPVDADTVFQLASMSKPLAATTVAALVSEGVVTWDDRVIDHDPGFQMYDPWVTHAVTIRDLFSHRSGLPGSAGNDIEEIGYDRAGILARLRLLPPAGSFRAQHIYSNFGLTAGAVAAARAAGLAWEDAAAVKLYRPLGMASTSSRYADYAAAANRALLHTRLAGKWAPQFTRRPDAQSPAGGASSTARDLAQWLRLLLNKGAYGGRQLIAAEALAEMYVPQINRGRDMVTGVPAFYGLGWSVDYAPDGRIYAAHAGAFSNGARTYVRLLPEEDLGIVVLANAFPTGVPDGLADTFFDLVLRGEPARDLARFWNDAYDAACGRLRRRIRPVCKPPCRPFARRWPLEAYAGTYHNDYVGDVEIAVRDAGLVLLVGPDRVAFPLHHWNRDTFLYTSSPDVPEALSSVRFTIGADGTADGVAIDTYAPNGQGDFVRVPVP